MGHDRISRILGMEGFGQKPPDPAGLSQADKTAKPGELGLDPSDGGSGGAVIHAKAHNAALRPGMLGKDAGADPVFEKNAVGRVQGDFMAETAGNGFLEFRSQGEDIDEIHESDQGVGLYVSATKPLALGFTDDQQLACRIR